MTESIDPHVAALAAFFLDDARIDPIVRGALQLDDRLGLAIQRTVETFLEFDVPKTPPR